MDSLFLLWSASAPSRPVRPKVLFHSVHTSQTKCWASCLAAFKLSSSQSKSCSVIKTFPSSLPPTGNSLHIQCQQINVQIVSLLVCPHPTSNVQSMGISQQKELRIHPRVASDLFSAFLFWHWSNACLGRAKEDKAIASPGHEIIPRLNKILSCHCIEPS